jgi:hypothetical protein
MVMAAIGKIIDSNPVVGGRTTNQILDTWKDGIFYASVMLNPQV